MKHDTNTDMAGVAEPNALPPRPRSRRRVAVAIGAVAFVAVLFGGGWYAATLFESPAQREAAAKAPPPSVITAVVERSDLAKVVTSTVDLAPSGHESLSLTGLAGKIVTDTPLGPGSALTAGSNAVELNDRPLIALPGTFDYYRDLTVGDTGRDVKQFQEGLREAGFSVGVDGKFGAGTERAVRALYQRLGYPAPAQATPPQSTPDGTGDGGASGAGNSGDAASTTETSTRTTQQAAPPPAPTPLPPFTVPMSELLSVASLPATIVAAPAIGTHLSGDTAIQTESGALQATSSVGPATAMTLKTGMPVQLTGPGAPDIQGTLTAITPGAKPEDNLTLSFNTPGLPADWRGQSVTATITAYMAAQNSLVVPSTAVVTQTSGEPYVLKSTGKNQFVRVKVQEDATMNGRSAIHVLDKTTLDAGDRVRVG